MKKAIFILLVVFLVLLFGCISNQKPVEKKNNTFQGEQIKVPLPDLAKNLSNNTPQIKTESKEDDDLLKDDLDKALQDLQVLENIK